jgi:glycine cleavage system H protein
MGKIESDDASSPLESPVSGEVVDVNADVLSSPDIVNSEPYDGGWLLKVRLDDPAELDDLMSEEEYTELTTEV